MTRHGKDDRLIGDSKASGASPAEKFEELAEVPSLFHVNESLRRFAAWLHSKGLRECAEPRAED